MERKIVWFRDIEKYLHGRVDTRFYPNPPESFTKHSEGLSPVILLPGLGERWNVMETIAYHVSGYGHNVFTIPNLKDNLNNLKESSDIVEDFINKNKLENSIAIGFSYGGLIGKQGLVDGWVNKLIALSTPFYGSDYARYASKFSNIQVFRELSSGSETIKKLHQYKEVNKDIISIFPEYDNLNSYGSALEGAENIVINIKGHHEILENKNLIKLLYLKFSLWDWDMKV